MGFHCFLAFDFYGLVSVFKKNIFFEETKSTKKVEIFFGKCFFLKAVGSSGGGSLVVHLCLVACVSGLKNKNNKFLTIKFMSK